MTVDIHAAYSAMVLIGIGLTLAFPTTRGLDPVQRRAYVRIQVVTLVCAVIGAKFAVIMGDALWPLRPFPHWSDIAFSGRSIVGALLFGFLGAEICKPLMHYQLAPNDRFAMMLPFSIGVGRFGCLIAGCCAGVQWDGPMAAVDASGVARFPSQLLEVSAQFATGALLVWLWRSGRLRGRLFSLYLICYGLFRFVSEFWRATQKAFVGFSAYQWLALALIFCGIWSFHRYRPISPVEQR